jgi:hypothetical protein
MLADEVRIFFDAFGLHTPEPTYIRGGEEKRLLPDPNEETEGEGEGQAEAGD